MEINKYISTFETRKPDKVIHVGVNSKLEDRAEMNSTIKQLTT